MKNSIQILVIVMGLASVLYAGAAIAQDLATVKPAVYSISMKANGVRSVVGN